MKSAPAKWANPGARILHLYGLLDPSLCMNRQIDGLAVKAEKEETHDTRYTAISPLGASIAA
jgi:hypothetical protein